MGTSRRAKRVETKVTCIEAPKGSDDLVGVVGWLVLDYDAAGRVIYALFDPTARGVLNAEFKVRSGSATIRGVELVEAGRGTLRWRFSIGARRSATPKKKATTKKVVRKKAAPPKRTSRTPTKERGSATPPSETGAEQEALALAHKLLAQWHVVGYRVVFNTGARMHKAMGVCDYRKREIRFSRLVWPRATKEQRRETVIHEVAHAVVQGRDKRATGHGAEWKAQMRAMGIKSPSAYHSVEVVGLLAGKRKDMVTIVCCGTKQDITIRRLKRLLGNGAYCRCGGGSKEPISFATTADQRKFEQFGLRANPAHVHVCGTACKG